MDKIRIAGVPEHFNIPWKLAIEYGLFERKKLNIEWIYYPAGTGAMVADMKSGKLDLAVLLTEGAVTAIAKGLKAKIVKQYISSPLIWGIHTGMDSGLSNIGECEGKKYAISRFGSGSHLMALIDAQVRNKEIVEEKFIPIETLKKALDSLKVNETEVFFWEKYMTKPYVDKGMIRRIGEFVTPWPCFQVVATDDFIENRKTELVTLLQVINFASKQFMKADNSIDMVLENFDMLPEDALSWFYSTEWNTDFQISEKMLDNVQFSLKKIGQIEKQLDSKQLVADFVDLS
jgi:sulfonate transport system substrate-binding protein